LINIIYEYILYKYKIVNKTMPESNNCSDSFQVLIPYAMDMVPHSFLVIVMIVVEACVVVFFTFFNICTYNYTNANY